MVNTLARCLLILLLGIAVQPVRAQPSAVLPDWLVPVVRVLPGDRVVPSTGIYLGEERVLVPSELTGDGGTLLVLDGGADLARFGRAAVIDQRLNVHGLAILRVAGLERAPPLLASPPQPGGAEIALQAYPPASAIAAGKRSLFVRSAVVNNQGTLTVKPDQPLPNVTGAITDACGYWVGHSAARGSASMASSQSTQYRFIPELQKLLENAAVLLTSASCSRSWPEPIQAVSDPVEVDSDSDTAPEPASPVAGASISPSDQDPLPEPEPDPEIVPEAPLQDEVGPEMAEHDSGQDPAARVDDVVDESSAWRWWLPALMAVSVLLVAIILIMRRRKVAEPGPLQAGGVISSANSDLKSVARLVGSDDHHLLVADDGQINALVGRFDADILLRSKSASRQHARLLGRTGAVLVEDLGSSNGTWCNDVRCQPFERVALQFGDELMFADERYRLEPPLEEGGS